MKDIYTFCIFVCPESLWWPLKDLGIAQMASEERFRVPQEDSEGISQEGPGKDF